jgi:hypothetical protein
MNRFDAEYYFLSRPKKREDLPSLTPDEATSERDFRYAQQSLSSPPLVFFNGAREYNTQRGGTVIKSPPAILFEGSNLLVRENLRHELLALDVPDLHMHPAHYVHDDGRTYDGYWYLAFARRFDCWDREHSDYDREEDPVSLGGYLLEQVYSYSLNAALLEETPLQQRLFFQLGGALSASFICHALLCSLFHDAGGNSIHLTPVAEY